jgi:alpha-glucosidase
MTLLDSHDTARFADVAATPAHHHIGLAWLLSYPGVPMVFAGDEVGVRGFDSDKGRAPFPWDTADWDVELFETARRLIDVRRSSPALQRGSLQFVHAGDDSITFMRELPDERVLVHLARAPHEPERLPAAALGVGRTPETLFGTKGPLLDGDDLVLLADEPAATICRIGP